MIRFDFMGCFFEFSELSTKTLGGSTSTGAPKSESTCISPRIKFQAFQLFINNVFPISFESDLTFEDFSGK